MEIFIIGIAAFFTAILTFFSGFGLGTVLTPVFVIFFPVEVAIALTMLLTYLIIYGAGKRSLDSFILKNKPL